MKKTLFTCLFLISVATSIAQDYFPTNSGLKQENNNYTAFTNATLYISPNKVIKKGTLLIQNGKVVWNVKCSDSWGYVPSSSVRGASDYFNRDFNCNFDSLSQEWNICL